MTATVPPAVDTTTPNPNSNQPATMETPIGAGGGVDLENMDANAYERFIAGLAEDGAVIESDDIDPAAAQPTAAAPVAAAPATAVVLPGDEHEEGILAPGRLPARLKIPTDDPLWFHTARFHKESRQEGRRLTPDQASALAKQYLGMQDEPAASTVETVVANTQEPTASAAPATGRLAELDQQLEAATVAFEEAASGFDPQAQATALRTINRLNREIVEAAGNAQRDEAAAVTQQAEAQTAFMQQWQAAEAQVHGMFAHAQAADPTSALHQRAAEIQASYRDSTDPAIQAIYNSPNSVRLYFTQAANELSIAPSAAPAPAPSSLQKSTPPPVSRHVPVGASLLPTTGGTTKPAAPGGFNIDAITNSHQLETLIARMAA